MPSQTPLWTLLSSAAAPVLLIGGFTLAAQRQPGDFDSTVETISALAALDATDRWLMTAALLGTGVSYVLTALGLGAAATPGRVTLGLGGVATMLVAAFPLPSADGKSQAHTAAATVAFLALAAWPAIGFRRRAGTPVALRPAVSITAAVVLLGLVALFGVALAIGELVGLAERVAAGAQSFWPLVVTLSSFVQIVSRRRAVAR